LMRSVQTCLNCRVCITCVHASVLINGSKISYGRSGAGGLYICLCNVTVVG
jgi:hypothetical protein